MAAFLGWGFSQAHHSTTFLHPPLSHSPATGSPVASALKVLHNPASTYPSFIFYSTTEPDIP